MGWRLSRSGWIGLALVLAGIALPLGWQRWLDTRTWVALDMPISLARGHIKSNEFEINLQGGYRIYIEVERNFDYEGVPCLLGLGFPECRDNPGIVKATWSVSGGPEQIAHGTSEGRGGPVGDVTIARALGWFAAGKSRHYVLNVDFLEDGSRLDAGHPRLKVQAESWPYWEYESDWTNVVLLALVLGSTGAAILIASLVSQARDRRARSRVSLTSIGPQPRELFFDSSERESVEAQGRPIRSLQVWFGIFLFVSGLAGFTAIEGWLSTRTWTPLDMPISLVRGHVRTGPFKINLKSGYSVEIQMSEHSRAPLNCYTYGMLKARWSLYRDGVHVSDWYDPSRYSSLGGFDAEKSTYDLDLEVNSDTSCLNANQPRLVIFTRKRDFEEYTTPALWLTGLFMPCGVSVVILGWLGVLNKETDPRSGVTGRMSLGQNFGWAQRLPLKRSFSSLPSFGLIGALVFVVVWLPMRLMDAIAFDAFRARGLYVHPARASTLTTSSEPWREAIVIRIISGGPRQTPKIYVNAALVTWPDLTKAVQRQIGRGSETTVYVTADDNVAWYDAVNAIDIVRGLGCKVVLLTSDQANIQPR